MRHAFFRLGCQAEAEDVVQDTLVKLYTQKDKYANVTNLVPYVYRMITNACTDKQRMVQRNVTVNIEDSNEVKRMFEPDKLTSLIAEEEFERLQKILTLLPAEQSEVLRYRIVDELSFTDIAKILEEPVTTIKSRFKYGLDKLKNYYVKNKEVNHVL